MCTYLKVTACICSCFIFVSIIIQSIVGYSYAINEFSNTWHTGHCSVVKSDTRIAKIFYNYMNDGHLYEGYINRTLLFNNKRIYAHNCKILTDINDVVLDIKLVSPSFQFEDSSSNRDWSSNRNEDNMMQLIVFSVLLFGLLIMLCIIVSEMNEISMINNKNRIKKLTTDIESTGSTGSTKNLVEHNLVEHNLVEQNLAEQKLAEPVNLRKAGIVYPPEYNFENKHKSYDEFSKKQLNSH